MKVAIIFLCLLALSYAYYFNCGNAADKIQRIVAKLTPDPPKVGENVTVNATAISSEVVTAGQLVFNAQANVGGTWVNLPVITLDICEQLTCPIASGPVLLGVTFEIPAITPRTEYKGELTATDQNGAQLFCLGFDYHLV
eukprot:TRINITY_DN222_c0_g1_i1.p1 TRINITY_DN222_c0_g1~~TRINITY_DN222_c0_g1_i1.p1  ORF type:complete len:163 (+),score=37.97 TRINITY_DN222_c0_g1_i1:72-491(+)